MATKKLNKIFLSSSIPYENRDPKYFASADIIAIRDAVRALATIVIPKAHLVWGGHPAITPLIRYVLSKMGTDVNSHVTLYQTSFFKSAFPEENSSFEQIILTPDFGERKKSIEGMRHKMISDNDFSAGIFIGGMEGVLDEYSLFKKIHPGALRLPVASTGAAAKIIYDDMEPEKNIRLLNEYTYMALFRDLLNDYI